MSYELILSAKALGGGMMAIELDVDEARLVGPEIAVGMYVTNGGYMRRAVNAFGSQCEPNMMAYADTFPHILWLMESAGMTSPEYPNHIVFYMPLLNAPDGQQILTVTIVDRNMYQIAAEVYFVEIEDLSTDIESA